MNKAYKSTARLHPVAVVTSGLRRQEDLVGDEDVLYNAAKHVAARDMASNLNNKVYKILAIQTATTTKCGLSR